VDGWQLPRPARWSFASPSWNRAARIARLQIRFTGGIEGARATRFGTGAHAGCWPAKASLADHGLSGCLTTLTVENLDQAVEKLRWYAGRWGIEVFHRVLKSGCKIETRQLGGADRIEACLAIDLVVAWRIFHLNKLGRETPDVPCTVYFQEHEWQALTVFLTRQPELPAQTPTLRQAQRMVAQLGGFLGRKGDGGTRNPGPLAGTPALG
jgi:hypothetical protein